jgi:hypothetical protein
VWFEFFYVPVVDRVCATGVNFRYMGIVPQREPGSKVARVALESNRRLSSWQQSYGLDLVRASLRSD